MKIKIGTKDRETVKFHLEDFDVVAPVSAGTIDIQRAKDMLKKELSSPVFTEPGTRNNSAVNICIALHVLGVHDPELWLINFFRQYDHLFNYEDFNELLNHAERVCDYVDNWGPVNLEYKALDYSL